MRLLLVFAILGVLALAPTVLADPHPHGSSSGGATSVSQDNDSLGIGIPDAPVAPPGYMETAELCVKHPGKICDLAVLNLEANSGINGFGAKLCKYTLGNIWVVRHYC